MQRVLSTVVLLGLLVATAGAFVLTEHLKLIKSPIYATDVTKAFSPVCNCTTDKASIGFKLRHGDRLTVTIVDRAGHTVATLATGSPEPKGQVTFFWNGRTDTGEIARAGSYQPQVELSRRTILMPNVITVDTTAPKVLSASDGKGFLVPSGPRRTIAITYALSEEAHPVLFLGGRQILLGRHRHPRGVLKWNGRSNHATLPAGRYVLRLGAVDLAGNTTPPSARKRVVVRLEDIALSPAQIRVPAGGSFSVKVQSVSPRYTWRLGGKHGTAHGRVLRLRAPSRHGRYALVVVGEHHHRATAAVIVRRR